MSASYKLSDIVHETDKHFVLRVMKGFEVYRKELTHSVRCAQIGYPGDRGMVRSIEEVNRREGTP